MIDIIFRFIASREGNWEHSLAKSNNILSFIVAAGHHYCYSLLLSLKEMNNLKITEPHVYKLVTSRKFTMLYEEELIHSMISPLIRLLSTHTTDMWRKVRVGLHIQPRMLKQEPSGYTQSQGYHVISKK